MTADRDAGDDSDASPTEIRLFTASGRYAIIVIAALAIGGAVFNWSYQRQLHRRSLQLWGVELAELIVQAPHAEAMRLTPDSDAAIDLPATAAETITVNGQTWTVVERQVIDTPRDAPGSSHVRRSMVNDRSFDWGARLDDCQPNWQFALRFRDATQTQTIVLDLDCPRVALVGSPTQASIRPVVAPLREFFSERFPRQRVTP